MSERRTISVILRAQTDDFAREMGKASKSLDELVRKEDKHGTVAQSTAGRIVQSARLQADAWGQVGSTMLGAGAALSGMSIAVAKTGIEYNTLQQTSRAALRAILGGAEQANAQMDKLDAFARTSPFSKSVFIQAQQQMLGFGIEARKVVPYLSAINEAVAATGGSNQDIAELTRIFSQVRAASKITATDLMQFGQRGVDAAALIGSQMGKTGAQIRDEITAGTLGADEALDALAAGMQQRFEGASAGVKNTMSGAIDRIKAAWRDLSSAVMEPAVGREGGGFLVGAANGVADFLRVIEKMPAPIRDSGAALTALSGVGLTAFGAFAMGLPRILETVRAFRELSAAVPALSMGMRLLGAGTLAAFGAIGIAAAAVALSMGSIQQQQAEAKSRVEAFTSAMQGQTDALNENVRAVAAKQLADAGAFDAARTLGLSLQLVTDAALGNESALARVTAEMERQQGAAREAVTNASRHGESLTEVGGRLGEVNSASHILREALGQTSEAHAAAAAASEDLAEASGESASAIERQAAALRETSEAMAQAAQGAAGLIGGLTGMEAAIDAATEAAEKNGKTLDANTEAGRNNLNALASIASSTGKYVEQLAKAGASQAELDAAMTRGRESFIQAAMAMDDTSASAAEARAKAEALADEMGLIPNQVMTLFTTPGADVSKQQAKDMESAVKKIPSLAETSILAPGARPSKAEVDDFVESVGDVPGLTKAEIRTIADLYGVRAAQNAIDGVRGKTVTMTVAYRSIGTAPRAVADGGMFANTGAGLVQAFQHGGFHASIGSQQPQIRPAGGAGILWAEDGAGPWEAFISGHPGKRRRSRWLLEETARRLGGMVEWATPYADGGIRYAPNYSPPPTYASAQQAQAQASSVAQPSVSPAAIRAALDGMRVDIANGRLFFDEHADRRDRSNTRRDRARTGVTG